MLGMVNHYDPDKHTLVPGELDSFIKRLVEGDDVRRGKLFLMRYNKLGVFVICEWIGAVGDAFVDVMNLKKSLASFDRAKADELMCRLFKPLGEAETSRMIAEAESGYHHSRQDDNSAEWEREELCARGL